MVLTAASKMNPGTQREAQPGTGSKPNLSVVHRSHLNAADAGLRQIVRPQAPIDYSVPRRFRPYYQWLDGQKKVPGVHERMDQMFGEELKIADGIIADGPLVTAEEAANAVESIERVDKNGDTQLPSMKVKMSVQLGKRKFDDVEDDDQEQDAAGVEDGWLGPDSQDGESDNDEDPTDRDYRPSAPRKSSTKKKMAISRLCTVDERD